MSSSGDHTCDIYQNVKDEYDSTERLAAVFLYTRPCRDIIAKKLDDEIFKHWALVFVFDEDSFRLVEAFKEDGCLVPNFKKEGPRTEEKFYELTVIKISPLKLREICIKHPMNGYNYSMREYNCQTWIKEYANKLEEPNLIEKLKEVKSLKEVPILLAAETCLKLSSRSSSDHISNAFISAKNSMFERISEEHI